METFRKQKIRKKRLATAVVCICFAAGIMLGLLVPLCLRGVVVIRTGEDVVQQQNSALAASEETLLIVYRNPEKTPAEALESPVVVIYCTHTSEEYAGETRVNGVAGGVMQVAAALADAFEQYGVTVILDKQLHDSPSYDQAYASSLSSITEIKAEYPEAEVFIDVHRDSAIEGVDTTLTVGKTSYARMMFVVGTNEKYEHPNWQTNYAFVQEVQSELENIQPGITREARVYSGRYNQHVADNAILVEFGSNENKVEEGMASAWLLAQAVAQVKGWDQIN